MFYDVALIYDPQTLSCDLAIGSDGDLVIDETPITSMLLSVELDRRAALDDELPVARDAFLMQAGIDVRRGSACDCIDPDYARIGSRCWLLERAKETEETRLLFTMWLEEALAWVIRETGKLPTITVQWIRSQTLQWRVQIDDVALSNSRRLA